MSKHFQRDLESIEQQMLAMSSIVEQMIDMASIALMRRQLDLATQVIQSDHDVDFREVAIEEECMKVLALHQPVASDLRRTVAFLKINNDLERIGDLAVNIAEQGESLILFPGFTIPNKLRTMATCARSMVRDALDAFVKLDVPAAERICAEDDIVDSLNEEIVEELQKAVSEMPQQSEPAFHLFTASHAFERIADHATNIAEDVVYLVDGEIMRHRHESPDDH
ncbi:MAG: phosphate signaling complex protein PhoU [Planctomycetota bacterium]